MAVPKFDEYLAPWEVDKDGKKLDTPVDVDPGRIKKYLHGLLADKEKLQETVADKDTEIAQVKDQLTTVQRENETKEQAAERQRKEQEKVLADAQALIANQKKLDVALSIPGITAERARVLAKRISGDDERALKADAEDLVKDGFRINDGKTEQVVTEDQVDDLSARPHQVRRADGTPVRETGKEKESISDLLSREIPVSTW